jgi:hypothetical protein
MGRGLMGGFLVLTLAGPAGVEAGPKKPRLVLRAAPRLGIAHAHVLATAELVGGRCRRFLSPSSRVGLGRRDSECA